MKLNKIFLKEASTAENADLTDFVDSLNPFFSPKQESLWERYTIQNQGLEAYAKSVLNDDGYQDALQQNLKRIKIPSQIITFRGHLKDLPPFPPSSKFVNVSLRKGVAKNFRQAKFSVEKGKVKDIDPSQWVVSQIVVKREDIIAHGNIEESEFIVLTRRVKVK